MAKLLKTSIAVWPGRDSYLALVRRHPLRPIRTKADDDAAAAMIEELATRGEEALDEGAADYLESLSLLVDAYDQKHRPIPEDRRTPLQRLKYVMRESGMTTAGLGRLLGNRGLASLIVHGKRGLSKAHIRKLAAHFRLDAGYFL